MPDAREPDNEVEDEVENDLGRKNKASVLDPTTLASWPTFAYGVHGLHFDVIQARQTILGQFLGDLRSEVREINDRLISIQNALDVPGAPGRTITVKDTPVANSHGPTQAPRKRFHSAAFDDSFDTEIIRLTSDYLTTAVGKKWGMAKKMSQTTKYKVANWHEFIAPRLTKNVREELESYTPDELERFHYTIAKKNLKATREEDVGREDGEDGQGNSRLSEADTLFD